MTKPRIAVGAARHFLTLSLLFVTAGAAKCQIADLILYSGKVTTMDKQLPEAQAIAIRKDRVLAVGSNEEIMSLAGTDTRKIDLSGRRVVPGLIDNHVHPMTASQSEYREKLPDLSSLPELFEWIAREASLREPGEWIVHPKFFFTRLDEKKWPSLASLDSVAPKHPVFLNGSYAGMVNSRALEVSGIDQKIGEAVVKDARTGRPTGLVRQPGFKYLATTGNPEYLLTEKLDALQQLFDYYNKIGITSICAGNGGKLDWEILSELRSRGAQRVRVFQNFNLPADPKASLREIEEKLSDFSFKTGDGDEWLRVGALKVVLDGGILTGTAFMGRAWGRKAMGIYGFQDPAYRGELNYSRKQLATVITAAVKAGWKFTAHVTGSAGVDSLVAAYGDVAAFLPVKTGRHSVIHGNFFSDQTLRNMARMGIYADVQPAWFYKDADLLTVVLDEAQLADFHPYLRMVKSGVIVNGGSDHMVKLDTDQAINPYNPFRAMWTMVTRKSQSGTVIHPEEAVTRQKALEVYTINNAYASFEEDSKGILSAGKLADLAVLSHDLLLCDEDTIPAIRSVMTIVGGQIVHQSIPAGKD